MDLSVLVDGVWAASLADVSEVTYSTVWSDDSYCGDEKASFSWGSGAASTARAGAPFEIRNQGEVIWSGRTTEPGHNGDGTVSVYASGLGDQLDRYMAGYAGGAPSRLPNASVDAAIGRGMPLLRTANLGASVIDGNDDPLSVLTLLVRAATAQGKHVFVDAAGYVSYATDPVTVSWVLRPTGGAFGTADDAYVSLLRGYYISHLDANGLPDTYATVTASSDAAAAQYGVRERGLSLYKLGLLTPDAAQAIVDGRFALVGARNTLTETQTVTDQNTFHVSSAPASPSALRAGDRFSIPGVMDDRLTPTVRGSVEFVAGKVTYQAESNTATVEPVGFVGRDFESAFTEPEPTVSEVA